MGQVATGAMERPAVPAIPKIGAVNLWHASIPPGWPVAVREPPDRQGSLPDQVGGLDGSRDGLVRVTEHVELNKQVPDSGPDRFGAWLRVRERTGARSGMRAKRGRPTGAGPAWLLLACHRVTTFRGLGRPALETRKPIAELDRAGSRDDRPVKTAAKLDRHG